MQRILIALLIILIIGATFYGRIVAADDEVIAKVGNKTITKADFERLISFFPENQKKMIMQDPNKQRDMVEKLVQSIVIARIARDRGFDKTAGVKEQIEYMIDDFLAKLYIHEEILSKVEVTDKEAENYYKAHMSEFASPEMARVRHIILKINRDTPEEKKRAVRQKAENALKRIKGGEDFAKVAFEVSEDTRTKMKGGDLGFIKRGRMSPEFDHVAFSLKVGDTSDVVETPLAYYIIKVEEKKQGEIPPYSQVKEKVKTKALEVLKKNKVKEFVDTAVKNAAVAIYIEVLEKK